MNRIFLLSPAHCGGERALLVLNDRARFDLARRLRAAPGAPLGEVFSFLSGLYFRGKLTYARTIARPPAGLPGVYVITPTDGLELAEAAVGVDRLRRFATVDIRVDDPRYRRPLLRHARLLADAAGPECEVVLLGSIATRKYVDPLLDVLRERLRFPSAFVGRGDMSRGGLLLRHARAGIELDYVRVAGAARRGARPAGSRHRAELRARLLLRSGSMAAASSAIGRRDPPCLALQAELADQSRRQRDT